MKICKCYWNKVNAASAIGIMYGVNYQFHLPYHGKTQTDMLGLAFPCINF